MFKRGPLFHYFIYSITIFPSFHLFIYFIYHNTYTKLMVYVLLMANNGYILAIFETQHSIVCILNFAFAMQSVENSVSAFHA